MNPSKKFGVAESRGDFIISEFKQINPKTGVADSYGQVNVQFIL